MNHTMHPNSLLAYDLERLNLTKRKAQVYSLVYDYQHNGYTVTDRQVMTALGYSDMNWHRYARCARGVDMNTAKVLINEK